MSAKPKSSELASVYGPIENGAWPRQEEFLTTITIPQELWSRMLLGGHEAHHIQCNKDMAEPLLQALKNIVERGFVNLVQDYGGCFLIRKARGLDALSRHAYGLAIDLNPTKCPLGSIGTQPKELVACFTDVGFTWGGDWKRSDEMHWQWCEED